MNISQQLAILIYLSIGQGVYLGLVSAEIEKYKKYKNKKTNLLIGYILTVLLWPIPVIRRLTKSD